jgi:hypothetical protein
MQSWEEVVDARRRENDAALRERPANGSAVKWTLQRFQCRELTSKRVRDLVRKAQPFVVSGLDLAPCDGDVLAMLRRVVGKRHVPVETAVGGTEGLVMSVDELLGRVEQGEKLYMYDVPIAKRLGALCESWRLPSWFCKHDYLKRTRLEHAFRNWPTLFVGAQGTRSLTHVDRWQGHFWMFQIHGCKQWTIWSPAELCLLSPKWIDKFDPSFPPVEELRGRGHPVVLDLAPGGLLFVPGGSPHAVVNLDLTVAMAGNFVDASNVDRVLADLRFTQMRYADDRGLYEALSEMDFEEDEHVRDDDEPAMEM